MINRGKKYVHRRIGEALGRLEEDVDVVIRSLQQLKDKHPKESIYIEAEHDYDGYYLFFMARRLETDEECAERVKREEELDRSHRKAEKEKAERKLKEKAIKDQIKKLEEDLRNNR